MSFQYETHPADNEASRLKQRLRGFTDAVLHSPKRYRDELGTFTSGLREVYLEGVRKGAEAPGLYLSELEIGTEVVDLIDGRIGVVAQLFVIDDKGFEVGWATYVGLLLNGVETEPLEIQPSKLMLLHGG